MSTRVSKAKVQESQEPQAPSITDTELDLLKVRLGIATTALANAELVKTNALRRYEARLKELGRAKCRDTHDGSHHESDQFPGVCHFCGVPIYTGE